MDNDEKKESIENTENVDEKITMGRNEDNKGWTKTKKQNYTLLFAFLLVVILIVVLVSIINSKHKNLDDVTKRIEESLLPQTEEQWNAWSEEAEKENKILEESLKRLEEMMKNQ